LFVELEVKEEDTLDALCLEESLSEDEIYKIAVDVQEILIEDDTKASEVKEEDAIDADG
jgi:hypothetical protein